MAEKNRRKPQPLLDSPPSNQALALKGLPKGGAMQFNQQNKGSVPRKKAAAAADGEPHHLPAQAAAVWVERGKGDPRASTQPYFQPHSSSLPLIRLSERGANTRTPLHTRYTNACLQGIVSQFFFVRLSPPPPSIVQARLGGGVPDLASPPA